VLQLLPVDIDTIAEITTAAIKNIYGFRIPRP
jgi:hypothetical protein